MAGLKNSGTSVGLPPSPRHTHMYVFSYLCKMRYLLNLVLENWNYLTFYLTFWVVILNGGLKLPQLSCHALEMTRDNLHHCLKFPLCFIFCHICNGKSEAKNFSMVIKVKLLVSKASNSCFKSLDIFQMLLVSNNQ